MNAGGQTITIATGVWSRKVAAYAVQMKKGMRATLDEEWPLLLRKIIDFTPPYKTRAQVGTGTFAESASDYSVGRHAVARDIYKTMRSFDPAAIRSKSLRKIVDTKDLAGFDAVAVRARGLMGGAVAVRFDASWHTGARDPRGIVQGKDRNRVVLGSDAQLLTNYVASMQSHVGIAKAGWAAAYTLVKAKDGVSLPSYVARHGTAYGSVQDNRNDEKNPNIIAVNRTPWAIRRDEGERIKAAAFASRINAISTKMTTYARLARENAGFKGKAA